MRTRAQRFLLGGLIATIYLYCFPYFEGMHSANELPRIDLTMAMVDEGSFAIDTGAAEWGKTVDMSPSGGHMYSNKAPGSSMFAIPSYLGVKLINKVTDRDVSLAELTWTFRFFTGIVPTLLFLVLLWRFLARFAPAPETRRLLLVGYALGSMAMTYSVLFISHQLAAICIATAYILSVWVVEEGLHRRWLWAAGLAAGAAPLVDYQAAFAGVPIAIYLIVKLVVQERQRWLGVLYAIGGAIPPIALLLFYHARAFGSPFRTGYSASESFAHFHQKGFLGMDKLRLEAFSGSMVAPDNGLLILCPMVLLAIPGWVLMARRKQWAHFAITLSVAIIYLAFISSINFWRGGWQLGPRYITAILPFLMVPIAVSASYAERSWSLRGIVLGLIGVGVAIYSISTAIFPHYPEKFANPFYELILPLLGAGKAAYNAGWLVGMHGGLSLVPYFGLLAVTMYWVACPDPSKRRSALLGLGITTAILLLYSLFPDGGKPAQAAYTWVESIMP